MRGMKLVGISAANRAAAGIAEGDIVEVDIRHVTSSEEAKSAQIRRRRIDKLVASLSGARRRCYVRFPIVLTYHDFDENLGY